MKCPSCAVIFPDHIKNCPRCKVGLVADDAPLDPKLRAEFKAKLQKAREQAKQEKKAAGKTTRTKAKKPRPKPARAADQTGAAPEKAPAPRPPEAVPATAPAMHLPRPAQKKPPMRLLITAAAVVVVVAVVAWFVASRESRAFHEAERVDTVEAFKGFLEDYPHGKHAEEARLNVARLSLEALRGTPDPSKLEAYLEEFGSTPYAEDARKEYEKVLLAAARDTDDLRLYRKFVEAFPQSPAIEEARQRTEELERINTFFTDPEYITRRVEPGDMGDSLQRWADANMHPGDTLYAFARNGDVLAECTLGDITRTSSRYKDLKSVEEQVDFYALRFPAFPAPAHGKYKLTVEFERLHTWIDETDEEALRELVVAQLRKAVPEETFDLVYPAPADGSEYWGLIQVAYSDQRYARAVDVPAEYGRVFRSQVALRLDLKTSEVPSQTWSRLPTMSATSPRMFPEGETGPDGDVILRNAAVELLSAKIPRLAPR